MFYINLNDSVIKKVVAIPKIEKKVLIPLQSKKITPPLTNTHRSTCQKLDFYKKECLKREMIAQSSRYKNLALFTLGLSAIFFGILGFGLLLGGAVALSIFSFVVMSASLTIAGGYLLNQRWHRGAVTVDILEKICRDRIEAESIRNALRNNHILSSQRFKKNVIESVPDESKLKSLFPQLSDQNIEELRRILETSYLIRYQQRQDYIPIVNDEESLSPDEETKVNYYKKLCIQLDIQKDLQNKSFWRLGLVGLFGGIIACEWLARIFGASKTETLLAGILGGFVGGTIGEKVDTYMRSGTVTKQMLVDNNIAHSTEEATRMLKILKQEKLLSNKFLRKNSVMVVPHKNRIAQIFPDLKKDQMDTLWQIFDLNDQVKKGAIKLV